MAPSLKTSSASGSSDAPSEEPPFVERDDGIKHLPPVRAHAFVGLVRAGAALARDVDAVLQRKHELSLHSFEVLLHLAAFSPDGSLRLSRLVHQAPLSQSQVSRLAAELEKRGFVQRSAAEDDGRGVVVSITPAGIERFQQAQETHLEDLDRRLFSRLTWAEVTQLAAITSKLLDDEAG